MKHFAVCLVLLLAGCSASMQPHPNLRRAVGGQPADASVLVVGDELVTAWLTPATLQGHPMWTAAGSPSGTEETSGSVLARLPALLAMKHYDVVVVLVGTFDILSPTGDDFPGPCTGATATDTCYNLDAMVALAHAHGAKVLVCTMPYTTDPAVLAGNPEIAASESLFDRFLGEEVEYDIDNLSQDGNIYLDMATAGIAWTTDGLVPNATGAQVFTAATATAIMGLHGTWQAR